MLAHNLPFTCIQGAFFEKNMVVFDRRVGQLGGAALGAFIDARYDGSITPMAIAAVIVGLVAFVLTRWSDAVWDRDAERQVLTPEEQSQAEAAAPPVRPHALRLPASYLVVFGLVGR